MRQLQVVRWTIKIKKVVSKKTIETGQKRRHYRHTVDPRDATVKALTPISSLKFMLKKRAL